MPQVQDWIAQSYSTNSAPLNASRVVNMFAETEIQDAKSKAAVGIFMHPGTAPFANAGAGPVIAFTTMGGLVYALTTSGLYRIDRGGVGVYLGATSVSPNGVSIDNNARIICWVDGNSGWIYNPDPAIGVKQILDPFWRPSTTVTYFDRYFVFAQRGSREFFISPPNWNGVTPLLGADMVVPGRNFTTKESTSDLLVAIINSHEQLFVCGEKRIEVWYNAANAVPEFPFSRSQGAMVQRGLMAPYSLVLEDNTLFFLGDDLMFYRIASGFTPERQSNHAVEAQWAKYPGHQFARAFSYTVFGHKMIVITFPAAKATWVLDLSTKRWHERESWAGDNHDTTIGRWRVNCALNSSSSIETYPEVLFGDSLTGRIDQMNNDVFTEFGNTMRALIIGPPIHGDRRRIFMKKFEIDVESGTGQPYTQLVQNEFCPAAITLTSPSYLETERELTGVGDTYDGFVFSNWIYVPDDGVHTGLFFGNSALEIYVGPYWGGISVYAWDDNYDDLLFADYTWDAWSNWVWVGISVHTPSNQIQVWVRTAGYPDTQLTPDYLEWDSTNPIFNEPGDTWTVEPL